MSANTRDHFLWTPFGREYNIWKFMQHLCRNIQNMQSWPKSWLKQCNRAGIWSHPKIIFRISLHTGVMTKTDPREATYTGEMHSFHVFFRPVSQHPFGRCSDNYTCDVYPLFPVGNKHFQTWPNRLLKQCRHATNLKSPKGCNLKPNTVAEENRIHGGGKKILQWVGSVIRIKKNDTPLWKPCCIEQQKDVSPR